LKTLSSPIQQTIRVKLFQQTEQLKNFMAIKNTRPSIQFSVNNIHFPEGSELYHSNTGFLNYKEDFFLSLHSRFKLKKSVSIRFIIESDDGFQLRINNTIVCKFDQPRSMLNTVCENIQLQQGIHTLSLDYFQGYGRLGLIAKYIICDTKNCDTKEHNTKTELIGNNSSLVDFLPLFENNEEQ